MSYTGEDYAREIMLWELKHPGIIYLNPMPMPGWVKNKYG